MRAHRSSNETRLGNVRKSFGGPARKKRGAITCFGGTGDFTGCRGRLLKRS